MIGRTQIVGRVGAHLSENRESRMTDNSADTTTNAQTLLRDGTGHWTLDPASSSVQFHVKHFWGLMTVHGRFEKFDGRGTVGSDGTVSGQLEIDARSLTTKNRKRDEHLRSADFFDVEHHPTVTITVDHLIPDGERAFRSRVTLEAAGRRTDIQPTLDVVSAAHDAVVLHSEAVVDRTMFGMTWSPLKMASSEARAVVAARFVRS
jgi:polyisoprenoid-binding protein YceI